MSTFPTDKQLPNTDNIIRQTDCSYSFQQEAVSLTLKFMGDVKEAVGLAASYRAGTRVPVSDLTGKFTELNNVLPTTQLEATGKVTASTSTTKAGSGMVSITVQVPYKAKISIGSGGGSDPEKRIITTWSEKSTDYEFPLEIYAGEGESASEANAGSLEAWKQEKTKNIENYKNFCYSVDGQDDPIELEGRTLDLAKKIYDGIESVRRAYPEVIRTTQYLNYKADADTVDDTLIKQITRKPPKLYYRDQTPDAVWKSLFANFDWLKSAYDVNCEATEYQKLWNITVTECWMGCDKAEKGTWDDELYGADGTRWKFSTANQPQPSGQYDDGTPIQPSDVDGSGRIKPDTFQNQQDIKDLDTGGDFYAVDDNSFKATPTRSLTAGVPDLETIKMPEINYIGNDAFNGAANLKSVRVENQVTFLGTNAFKGCTSMTEAHFSPSIYTMPASTFEGCTSLDIPPDEETMKIGGLVNAIGDNAFKDCTELTAVECMNAISSIGDNAFDGDAELKFFGVPTDSTGTITLGDEAFKGCAKLADIELPVPTITLGTDTFDGAFDDEVTVKAPKSFLANLPVTSSYNYIYPAFVDTMATDEWKDDTRLLSAVVCEAITEIPENAFRGCSNCTSVQLPDTITNIVHDAFRDSGITSFTVPPLMTGYLRSNTFNGCTDLETVDFNNATIVGDDVFNGCTSLSELINEDNLTSVQARSFSDCALTEFDGGSGLTNIGANAFRRNSTLRSFIMPENESGTLTLGNSVFDSCTALERIDLPVGTLSIGTTIFNNALADEIWLKAPFNSTLVSSIPSGKLVNFIYPSFTTSIAQDEWKDNTTLKTVGIPDSVTSIGTNALRACTSLTEVTIPESVTTLGNNVCFGDTSLTTATIGNIAGNYMFGDCSALTEVNITGSPTVIGTAFTLRCTSLTSFTVPDTVTQIGSNVFDGCTSLAAVTIPVGVTSFGTNIFRGVTNASLVVTFTGRTMAEVQALTNYPFALTTAGQIIRCSDGDITIS